MNVRTAMLIAAVGSLATVEPARSMGPTEGMEQCYGVARAGQNDCAANGHSCAGRAAVDGDKNEWILVPKGTCAKIVGGSLKPGGSPAAPRPRP